MTTTHTSAGSVERDSMRVGPLREQRILGDLALGDAGGTTSSGWSRRDCNYEWTRDWNQGARSPAGAVGVMQVMPETTAWLERDVLGYELNEDTSAYDNVKAGTRLLRILLDETGDIDLAIASYYQGQGATSAGILYDDTKGYVRLVRGAWDRYWR